VVVYALACPAAERTRQRWQAKRTHSSGSHILGEVCVGYWRKPGFSSYAFASAMDSSGIGPLLGRPDDRHAPPVPLYNNPGVWLEFFPAPRRSCSSLRLPSCAPAPYSSIVLALAPSVFSGSSRLRFSKKHLHSEEYIASGETILHPRSLFSGFRLERQARSQR
jgi:hypothetical protein